jgi:glycosyltransferase involved in cell wall biosynthesis
MKICYIGNGSSWHVYPWIEAMALRGHQVCLIDESIQPTHSYPSSIKIFRLHRISKGSPKLLAPFLRIINMFIKTLEFLKILITEKPHLLHIIGAYPSSFFTLFSGSLPYCLTALGAEILDLPTKKFLYRITTELMGRRANAITADSSDVVNGFRNYGIRNKIMECLYWGIDTQKFHPNLENSSLKSNLNLENGPIILSPRRLEWYYNIDVILEAVPLVLAQMPEAKFIIKYGDGEVAKYQEQAKKLEIEDVIRFIGYISDNDMPAMYSLADIVLSVPTFDSTPRAIFEAAACGALPVVSDLPWTKEIAWQNEKDWWIVPAKSASNLASTILKILKIDPDVKSQIEQRNFNYITKNMEKEQQIIKLEKIYYSIIQTINTPFK